MLLELLIMVMVATIYPETYRRTGKYYIEKFRRKREKVEGEE